MGDTLAMLLFATCLAIRRGAQATTTTSIDFSCNIAIQDAKVYRHWYERRVPSQLNANHLQEAGQLDWEIKNIIIEELLQCTPLKHFLPPPLALL